MIKFQQSQALNSHFESFWSIVELYYKEDHLEINPLISFFSVSGPSWVRQSNFSIWTLGPF